MKYLKKDGNVVRVADDAVLEGHEEATQFEYVAQMNTLEDWPAVKAGYEAEGEVFPEESMDDSEPLDEKTFDEKLDELLDDVATE